MPPHSVPQAPSKQQRLLKGRAAYDEIVRIIQSYHQDAPLSALPLGGLACRRGHLVLERERICKGGCPIMVMRIGDHPAYPMHGHDFHEISLIMSGTGVNVVDGQSFQICAGDVFVLHGSHEHSIEDPEGLEILNICYDPNLLRLDSKEFPDAPGYRALFEVEPPLRKKGHFRQHLRLDQRQLARIAALAENIQEEVAGARPAHLSVARAQLMEVIALLARWHECSDQEALCDTRRIAKALQWMDAHFAEAIEIEELGRLSGLSRSHFYRLFKACTNQTPSEYLLSLRLRRAQELLRGSAQNVTEIAFACGFNDSSHFSRAFKIFAGASPRKYRRSSEIPTGTV
jgi:AraC-like DNA-binding protein